MKKDIRTHYQPNPCLLYQLKFLSICKIKQRKKENSPRFRELRFGVCNQMYRK